MRQSCLRLAMLLGCFAICAAVLTWGARGQPAKKPALPALEPVFGKNAAWSVVSGTYTVAADKLLGRSVLTVGKLPLVLDAKAASAGAREVRALVRLRTDTTPAASAALSLARKDVKDPGLRMVLSTSRGAGAIACQVSQSGKPLHDAAALAKGLDWEPTPATGFTYQLRAYGQRDIAPGWPKDVRARIEHDMAALPDADHQWLAVRVELREGEVRFWLDDHLVAHKKSPAVHAAGLSRLELSPGAQIASYEEKPWTPPRGFEPLRLDGYANGRAFLGGAALKADSLPTGNPARINGIPFVFPGVNAEGHDHIDVGRSLYRQANLTDYMPSNGPRWAGSTLRDPARIQLRIPNGQYDTLYLIAASDDTPDRVPLVTAMFFRPGAGFATHFAAKVPLATAQSTGARAVPVTLTDGRQVKLWLVKIPLDPGRLSAFADMDIVEVELTKKVHLYRSYPDPFIYGWHQGGPASAVHVFGMTLGKVPVGFTFEPLQFGHVWTVPELPGYKMVLTNHSPRKQKGTLTLRWRSYDRSDQDETRFSVHLVRQRTLTQIA